MTDFLIVHWFGAIFDLTVAFFLIYKPTRPTATLFAMAFHFMNSQLFTIGMFPWVCLVELPLFYSRNWPRLILQKISFGKIAYDDSIDSIQKDTNKKIPIGRHLLLSSTSQFKDKNLTTTEINEDNNKICDKMLAHNFEWNESEMKQNGDDGRILLSDGDENHHQNVICEKKDMKKMKKFLTHNEKSKSSTSFVNSFDVKKDIKSCDPNENANLEINDGDYSKIESNILAKDQKYVVEKTLTATPESASPSLPRLDTQDDFTIHYYHYNNHGNDNDVNRDKMDDGLNEEYNITKSNIKNLNSSKKNDFTNTLNIKVKNVLSSFLNPFETKTTTQAGGNKNRGKKINPQVSARTKRILSHEVRNGDDDASCFRLTSSPIGHSPHHLLSTHPGGTTTRRNKIAMTFMIIYCGLQLFLPYSHFITKVSWRFFYSLTLRCLEFYNIMSFSLLPLFS